MLLKKINYTDYNGVNRTEEFCFNISKAELTEMEVTTPGGFGEKIKKIVDSQDSPTLMKMFKEIILLAYGIKSEDGKRIIKNEEISNSFAQSEAYSELLMELLTKDNAASDFITAILPKMDNTSAIPAPLNK